MMERDHSGEKLRYRQSGKSFPSETKNEKDPGSCGALRGGFQAEGTARAKTCQGKGLACLRNRRAASVPEREDD